MAEQRKAPPPEKSTPARLWLEGELPAEHPTRRDAYAVIDDLKDGTAVLILAPWPFVDEAGRLTFLEEPAELHESVSIEAVQLQSYLASRQFLLNTGQIDNDVLAKRPLRIGDTFLIQGVATGSWEAAIDVTVAAREAAKVAFYAAVAPRLTRSKAQVMELIATDDDPIERLPPERPPLAELE